MAIVAAVERPLRPDLAAPLSSIGATGQLAASSPQPRPNPSRAHPGRSRAQGDNAQAAGETSDTIIARLMDDIPVRKGAADAGAAGVFRS